MRPLRELLVRNRDFRRLFLASVVSMAGDWFSYVAVASLVTELTGKHEPFLLYSRSKMIRSAA